MFKFLTYIILFYLLYRLVKPKWLKPGPEKEKIGGNIKRTPQKDVPKEGEYIDYEEVE